MYINICLHLQAIVSYVHRVQATNLDRRGPGSMACQSLVYLPMGKYFPSFFLPCVATLSYTIIIGVSWHRSLRRFTFSQFRLLQKHGRRKEILCNSERKNLSKNCRRQVYESNCEQKLVTFFLLQGIVQCGKNV